jgi:hypothetical protein
MAKASGIEGPRRDGELKFGLDQASKLGLTVRSRTGIRIGLRIVYILTDGHLIPPTQESQWASGQVVTGSNLLQGYLVRS